MSLDQLINNTKLYQDIELATAIGELKQNPQQLQQFLQTQQNKIYEDVTKQKDATFQKVYGDLTRITKAQESSIMYNVKNIELSRLNKNIYESQKKNAESITYDKELANRKYEMNEWSVNNKKDTLFIYSMLFIMLSGFLLLIVLWRAQIINSGLCVKLGTPLLVIFIFTLVYRSQHTKYFRDKRYWNRQTFGKFGEIPMPLCAVPIDQMTNGMNSINNSINNDISTVNENIMNQMNSPSEMSSV